MILHPFGVPVELRLGSSIGKQKRCHWETSQVCWPQQNYSIDTSSEYSPCFFAILPPSPLSQIKPLWNNCSRNCKIHAKAHFAWQDCWKSWMVVRIQLTLTLVSDCSHIWVTSQVLSMTVQFKLMCAVNLQYLYSISYVCYFQDSSGWV